MNTKKMAEVAKNSMENTENESKYANQEVNGTDNVTTDVQKDKDKKDSKTSGPLPVIGEHYLVRRSDGTWRELRQTLFNLLIICKWKSDND
jgi:hypothetical protein